MSRRAKYQRHPQEGPLRLISDNCVWVEDVALCDALECQYLAYPFSKPKTNDTK